MTPTQIELHNAHKARLRRIAQAAERLDPKTDKALYSALNAGYTALNEISGPVVHEKTPAWFYNPKEGEVAAEKAVAVSIRDVQNAACHHFGISLADLRKVRRLHAVVRPRQIAMYLCRELTVRSLPEIGRMFGGYDHTTVMHAARRIEELVKSDWRLAYDVAHIERLLA